MTSEVTELIKALRDGSHEPGCRWRSGSGNARGHGPQAPAASQPTWRWPPAAQEDPEPYVPGSFDERRSRISIAASCPREQYRTLAEAVAESMRAEDRRLEEGQGGA